ncbi:MAG: hypothetical protein M1820_001746 [Bogoriella megaspora]|nr:MAG: hypothetical protein M1820_001746 [Bogoriella megaspora]
MVFQLTLRLVGCREIAEDPEQLRYVLKLYETLDKSSTSLGIMFPRLPLPSTLKRNWAGFRLYMVLQRIADARKKEGRKEDDALQYLLDHGDSIKNVVSFVAGALFAGVVNSSINAGAILAFLSTNPKWQQKVYEEVVANVKEYASKESEGQPIAERLKTIPLDVWETKFVNVDLCLKESIRLNLLGCGYRRNISNRPCEIPGSKGEVIPAGQFATYHLADIHYNPSIYTSPQTFDPERYLPGREEDKSVPFAWVGWGAGRHPCLGMRFAKLESNLVVGFAIRITLPGRPEVVGIPKRPVYVKFKEREMI